MRGAQHRCWGTRERRADSIVRVIYMCVLGVKSQRREMFPIILRVCFRGIESKCGGLLVVLSCILERNKYKLNKKC